MIAWLVVNEFLNTTKFTELNQWLVDAAREQNVELQIKTNGELVGPWDMSLPDFVIFWDKDIRLAARMEALGLPVYNNAKAIEICDDKSYTFEVLEQANLPMPRTIVAPKTFEGIGYSSLEWLAIVEKTLGYPMVIKECFGSFGQQVYLVHSKEEMMQKVNDICPKPFIFQEFIASSFAKDIRLQVVGDKVVASMYRYSDNGDFRANITNGGKMKTYEPTEEEKKLAVQACKAIGLDFAGVDLLFGSEGHSLICEVNSNAHFKNIYDCTKVNVAECIMKDIVKKFNEKGSLNC